MACMVILNKIKAFFLNNRLEDLAFWTLSSNMGF